MKSASSGVSMRTSLSFSMLELPCTGVCTPTGEYDTHCTNLHLLEVRHIAYHTLRKSRQNGLATFSSLSITSSRSYSNSKALQPAMPHCHCITGRAGHILSRLHRTAAGLPSCQLTCPQRSHTSSGNALAERKSMHLLNHVCPTCIQCSVNLKAILCGCTAVAKGLLPST